MQSIGQPSTYRCATSPTGVPRHLQVCHVTYRWATSPTGGPRHLQVGHVTYRWATSPTGLCGGEREVAGKGLHQHFPPHTPLIPRSYPPHTPLIPRSYPAHTPLIPRSYPPHTPLIPPSCCPTVTPCSSTLPLCVAVRSGREWWRRGRKGLDQHFPPSYPLLSATCFHTFPMLLLPFIHTVPMHAWHGSARWERVVAACKGLHQQFACARWERVVAARKGLDQRLLARINLVDSYAKVLSLIEMDADVLSMIEIEVEMDADVPTAEAAGAAASIADQIERLMEVESLQKEWKQQAEVNDELERLLRSVPALPDSASWQS
ncbi:unnamed protein product [Closterium sp. NIES-65]|nr:unnamed protein product [Closterium sp. NIES-65]